MSQRTNKKPGTKKQPFLLVKYIRDIPSPVKKYLFFRKSSSERAANAVPGKSK
jgi:hypothetical protein